MIADDEYLIRWSLSRTLSEQGHEVVSVENGNEAIEVVRREAYDLVITDLFMPGSQGWEVLDVIRQNWPQTRVIIMTSEGREEIEKVAKERGAWAYVEKPYVIEEIKALLSG